MSSNISTTKHCIASASQLSLSLSFHSFKERGARNALDQLSAVSYYKKTKLGGGDEVGPPACSLSAILVAFK